MYSRHFEATIAPVLSNEDAILREEVALLKAPGPSLSILC
jgi:hypothetical protein